MHGRRHFGGARRAALAAAAAVIAASAPLIPASAQLHCSEPVAPICVRGIAGGVSDPEGASAQARCKADVRTYLDRMREYGECLAGMTAAAEERATEIAERLECMEEGGSDCFRR